jgi:hypothetical protein
VTAAFPVSVSLHVLLVPVQAPDQTALRPFETVSVIAVPVLNDACVELPTATLIPAGLEVTRWPLRPVAVTVRAAVGGGGGAAGFTNRGANCACPPAVGVAKTLSAVAVVTAAVGTWKAMLVAP